MLAFSVAYLLGVSSLPLSSKQPVTRRSSVDNEEGHQHHHTGFYHPYIKQLYESISDENGSLITGNLGDDPITIWSFFDIGKHFVHVVKPLPHLINFTV